MTATLLGGGEAPAPRHPVEDGLADPTAGRTGQRQLAQSGARMVLTLLCGAAGAFAASRALPLERVVVAATIAAALAAAAYAGVVARPISVYAALVPLSLVAASSLASSQWFVALSGIVAGMPFGISAMLYPRPASGSDTLFCALAGATLGVMPAFFVLFAASLVTVGIAVSKRRPAATVRFAPCIAAFTLIALLGNLTLAA